MNFKVHITSALANIFMAKMRSVLAILGVLVGTAAVVALIASSRLATEHALAQFKALGTNLLAMSLEDKDRSAKKSTSPADVLTLNEVPELVKSSPQILTAAPYMTLYQSIVLKGERLSGQILGATETLQKIAKMHVTKGRFVSFLDRNTFFCVIGSDIAKKFQDKHINPIGQQIQAGKKILTIIGVMAPWQPNLFLYININKGLIVPIETAYLMQADLQINDVLFGLIQRPNLDEVQAQLTTRINHLLPNKRPKFRNPEQIIKLVSSQRKTFNMLLIAIGSIALVVGGIGVMNIMLVSVIERRREIGIRMAIGARQRDILEMFLIESVMLTVFGGFVGIVIGVGVTFILTIATGWTFHLYFMPPALGFAVSVLTGVLSGFYPAWRASTLDPIECLRS